MTDQTCTCKLPRKKDRTFDTLRNLGQGCTGPYFICPVLDKARRESLTDYYRRQAAQEDTNE